MKVTSQKENYSDKNKIYSVILKLDHREESLLLTFTRPSLSVLRVVTYPFLQAANYNTHLMLI